MQSKVYFLTNVFIYLYFMTLFFSLLAKYWFQPKEPGHMHLFLWAESKRNTIVQNNNNKNNNYSFIKMHLGFFLFWFSTLIVLWLFTKAPLWLYSEQHQEHPEGRGGLGEGGVGVFRMTGSSLSSTAPHALLPDLTAVTSRKVKSRDSGPTRARSNFPWPALSWQGLGGHSSSTVFSVDMFFLFFLGGGWGGKGGWISACGS